MLLSQTGEGICNKFLFLYYFSDVWKNRKCHIVCNCSRPRLKGAWPPRRTVPRSKDLKAEAKPDSLSESFLSPCKLCWSIWLTWVTHKQHRTFETVTVHIIENNCTGTLSYIENPVISTDSTQLYLNTPLMGTARSRLKRHTCKTQHCI